MPRTSRAEHRASSNYKNLLIEPPDQAIGRSRGGLSTKSHQLVDRRGLPLVTACMAGQDSDSPMLIPLMEHLRVRRRSRPDAVRGDKAYSSRADLTYLREHRVQAVIPEPRDQTANRQRRGSLGGRPPRFDGESYRGRNVIEHGYCRLKQWRGLATRYNKLAIVYRAAVVLNRVVAWLELFNRHARAPSSDESGSVRQGVAWMVRVTPCRSDPKPVEGSGNAGWVG